MPAPDALFEYVLSYAPACAISVDGKVALVTGASRGIGQATALELAMSGAEGVVLTSRKLENLEQSQADLISAGAPADRLHVIAARADSEEDAEMAVAETIERFGACDILVNNAGTNPAAGPLVSVDLGAVDKTWAVNQRGPLVWCQQAVRQVDGRSWWSRSSTSPRSVESGRPRCSGPTTSPRRP